MAGAHARSLLTACMMKTSACRARPAYAATPSGEVAEARKIGHEHVQQKIHIALTA